MLEDIETSIRDKIKDAPEKKIESAIKAEIEKFQNEAARVFTGELNQFIENVRKTLEQRIDISNPDEVLTAGWDEDNEVKAKDLINDFAAWIQEQKDELTALQIFYGQPYRRRELTYAMIKQVLEKLKSDKPVLAPFNVWRAYESLEKCNGSPQSELTAIVSLIRRVCGADTVLTAYDKTVDKNFQNWVFKKQSGPIKFNEEQMQWLRMIKDYVVNSFHIEKEDFDLNPFNAKGGLSRMWQLFGDKTEEIIGEMNEALAA
jgi:type I restriction enzyme R subunit